MSDDFLSSLPPEEFAHELFELELMGDPLFTVGVPANAPAAFKQMVFAAGKTYVMGNSSVDYMLRQYGSRWTFDAEAKGFHPVYLDISYFVVTHVDREIERFMAIPKKHDVPGLFAAGSALVRLHSSFRSACLLLRQHWWLETACVLKLILEQIAWSYAVCKLGSDALLTTEPPKAVRNFKLFYPTAGKMYGELNEMSHVSPERTIDYLDFSGKHPGVYLSSGRETTKCAYFLLLLVDMFLSTSEFVHQPYYKKRVCIEIEKDGCATLKPRRKILRPIEKFRKKLNRLRKKHSRPKFRSN